jgi:phage-related tail protein
MNGEITLAGVRDELTKSFRGFATGGFYPGGMAMVGEQGPELINFSRPGQVYTASETQNIMRGGSDSSSELRQLREENRIQSRAMVALQNRMTRLLERWDGDGLPSERFEGQTA